MSPRTRLILIIVIVALLFSLTLLVRFFVSDGASSNASSRPPSAAKNQLLKSLAGLSPGIDVTKLNCNGQRADRSFSLTKEKPECKMRIGREKGTRVRSAQLTTDTAGLAVYVIGEFEEEKSPKEQRDKRSCLISKNDLDAFRLMIKYEPQGKSVSEPDDPQESGKWSCYLKQNKGDAVKIVATENGGSLNLECVGCKDASRKATLRLE